MLPIPSSPNLSPMLTVTVGWGDGPPSVLDYFPSRTSTASIVDFLSMSRHKAVPQLLKTFLSLAKTCSPLWSMGVLWSGSRAIPSLQREMLDDLQHNTGNLICAVCYLTPHPWCPTSQVCFSLLYQRFPFWRCLRIVACIEVWYFLFATGWWYRVVHIDRFWLASLIALPLLCVNMRSG